MKFGDLRGILQYVPQFRGRTFVIALDGAVVASRAFSDILLDLAVLRSLNIRVVLVHGAGIQIKELAEKRGIHLTNSDGTGPTDDASMEVSLDAVTRLSSDIMQKLAAVKIRAASANAVNAHPAGIRGGIDYGHTGELERVDSEAIDGFLDQDIMPLISPVGYHSVAGTLRLNSDEVAMETATAIEADKVIFMVKDSLSPLITKLGGRQASTEDSIAVLKESSVDEDWFRSKLKHATTACENGVPRTHIISLEHEDALLAELFSNAGVGVMISNESYRKFRDSVPEDIDELMFIMRRAVDSEKLIRRTREDLQAILSDFVLLEIDGHVVGCVAVHYWESEKLAEMACLYVKRSHDGQGYGKMLLNEAVRKAEEMGAKRVFALSTQAIGFFEGAGFSRCDNPEVMPEERRLKWATNGRNAAVLVRDLVK